MLFFACLLGLTGLSGVSARQVDQAAGAGLPMPDQRVLIDDALDQEYLIGPMDKLIVNVVGFPDFGGKIQLPLVGSNMAAGKTTEALSNELQLAYDHTSLKHPRVSVGLKEGKSRFVTLEGQVKQPGLYPVPTRLHLSSAIALAQGVNEFANIKNVAVLRKAGDQRLAAIFNLKDIRLGRYQDPAINPNDVNVVGNSPVHRLFRDIIQTAPFIAVFGPFG